MKISKLIFLCVFASSLAFGQGSFIGQQTAFKVVNGYTMPIANATITVCAPNASGIPCAPALTNTIFSNSALTQPLTNPFQADSYGNYNFAALPATYTVTVTAAGYTGNSYQVTMPSSSGSSTPGSVGFASVTAGANLNALQVGSGGSFTPAGFGFIANNSSWFSNTDPIQSTGPTLTLVSSGGSLTNAHNFAVEVTYVSSIGETTPSGAANQVTGGCASNNCSITVNSSSLTLPAGFTGYTVYARDTTAAQSFQQIAGCVNITSNCTITSIPTTTSPPTSNAVMPKPTLAKTSVCPPGVTPNRWVPDANGNQNSDSYISWFFTSANQGPQGASNAGIVTHCRPTWESDQGVDPPTGKNAFHIIDHNFNNGTFYTGGQQRVLWVNGATAANDTGSYYAVENIQTELDWQGTTGLSMTGNPDGEVSPVSVQLSEVYNGTNGGTAGGYGLNAIRASFFINGTNNYASLNNHTIYAEVSNNATNTAAAGTTYEVYTAKWANSALSTNMFAFAYSCRMPANPTKFAGGNACFYLPSTTTSGSGGANDEALRNEWQTGPGLPWNFAGPIRLTTINNDALQAMIVNASLSVTGSVSTTQLANGFTSGGSVNCTGGASTYQYQIVAVDNNGGQVASAAFQCNSGTNPLTSGNPATISNVSPGQPGTFKDIFGQSVHLDVYRTGGPMALGKIGTITCPFNFVIYGCTAFSDTGLAATGTVPSVNTTGGAQIAGYLGSTTNTVRVASNFTTAASTSLQTITGLSWNLDANAKNYSYMCHIAYSQATANAAVAFGIQAATVAPTNIFGKGSIHTSATAFTDGVLATLASTTATNIVSATPSATATNFTADIEGTIEQPQNNQGQVINIMVSTATSGDAVTVLRGSYCQLF